MASAKEKTNQFLASGLYDDGKKESYQNSMSGEPGQEAPGLENLKTNTLLERQSRTLQAVQKTALKVVEMVDGGAKRANLPGVGNKQFQEDYVEVGMTWVEQMAGDPSEREKIMKFLRRAPGLCFGILSVGIASRNALEALAKNEPKKTKEDE